MGDFRLTSLGVEVVHAIDNSPKPVRLTSLGLEVVHTLGPQAQPLRLTSLGLELATVKPVPHRPEIINLIPSSFYALVELAPFEARQDGQIHVATNYQVTLDTDPSFSNPVLDFATETGLEQELLEPLDPETDYLVRARVMADPGDWSFFSDAVPFTTEEGVPVPDKPTVIEPVDAVGEDLIHASMTAFSHEDGTVPIDDFDPENPLPYLIAVQWQIREVGDPWGGDLDQEFGPEGNSVQWSDLEPDTQYEIRGRHQDGYHNAWSLWSDAVLVQTDAIPLVRPDTPEITLDTCSVGLMELSADEFTHEEAGAVHEASEWRFCVLGPDDQEYGCGSDITTDPDELRAWTQENPPVGVWSASVRYRDDSGRWSLWSDPVSCSIPMEPRPPDILEPVAGAVFSQVGLVRWEHWADELNWALDPVSGGGCAPAYQEPDWLSTLLISGDLGETWETLEDSIGGSVQGDLATLWEHELSIGGRPDGIYVLRVRVEHPDNGTVSDWASTVIYINRGSFGSFHYDFTQAGSALQPTWVKKWDTESFTYKFVDDTFQEVGETAPVGLLARNATGMPPSGVREGALAFEELGEPTQGEFITQFALVPREEGSGWYPWLFTQAQYLRGGMGLRISGTVPGGDRKGMNLTANGGGRGNPWHWISAGVCHDPQACRPWCPCRRFGCSVCRDQPDAYRVLHGVQPDNRWRFGLSSGTPGIVNDIYDLVQGSFEGASLPVDDTLTRGMWYSRRQLRGTDACDYKFEWYTMVTRMERLENGDLRVRSKVFGPGIAPEGWPLEHIDGPTNFEERHDGGCGFVGICAHHTRFLTNDHGVLFRSFSAANLEYEGCDAPPEPPEFEDIPGVCVVGRKYFLGLRASDELREYQDIPRDDDNLIESVARTREVAPFGIQAEASFSNLYFSLSAWTEGTVILTPIVDGERKLNAQQTIEYASDGTFEFTKRYELALFERVMDGDDEVGRRSLRGTWFRLEVEIVDEEGVGRVNAGGFELEAVPVVLTHPDQVYHDEPAVRRDFVGMTRKYFFGLAEGSGELLEYGASVLDLGDPVPLYALSRPIAPAGPGGEVTFRELTLSMYRFNTAAVTLTIMPIVDGFEYPVMTLELDAVENPVRETHHLDIYRPTLDGETEIGRALIRGTWWEMEVSGPLGVPDGLIRIGAAELMIDPVIETEEPV